MWVLKTPQQTYRQKWCNCIGMFIVVGSVFYIIWYWVVFPLIQMGHIWNINNSLWIVIDTMAYVCLIASKSISVWYYWNQKMHLMLQMIHKISKTNKRIILFFVFYTIASIWHYGAEFYDDPKGLD
eukprot:358732_1